MSSFSALQEAREFREQLSSGKRRIGFLFGAGTSQSVGLDGIWQLTDAVGSALDSELAVHYQKLREQAGPDGHVEQILSSVRLRRELLGDSADKRVDGLSGKDAARLDRAICDAILTRVQIEPPKGLKPHINFSNWVRSVERTHPVEIFTTNYDVLIERGLEATMTPHFDGFVGSFEPHFAPGTVDPQLHSATSDFIPPASWVRVWKIHGSIGWRVATYDGVQRIIRVPHRQAKDGEDLLIYPSRDKYSNSRKQPYVSYQDRLRRFVLSGEAMLVIAGYSFGDQHLNEIIFEGLRTNRRLAVTVLVFGDLQESTRENLIHPCEGCRNLTVYSGNQALIGGSLGPWSEPGPAPTHYGEWPFWSESDGQFTLGDFSAFTDYLRVFLGVSERQGVVTANPDNGGLHLAAVNSQPSAAVAAVVHTGQPAPIVVEVG